MNKFLTHLFILLIIQDLSSESFAQDLFSKAIGSEYPDHVNDTRLSRNGKSIFILGKTSFNGPDTTFYHNFLAKMDTSGQLLWMKGMDSYLNKGLYLDRVFETTSGDLMVTGEFIRGKKNGVLVKLDSSGNLKWLKRYQLDGQHYPTIITRELVETTDQGYAMIGYAGAGYSDLIIMWMRVDSMGNPLYYHRYGKKRDDYPVALFNNKFDGFYYITQVGNLNNTDAFVRVYHLDATGDILWAKNINQNFPSILTSCIRTADSGYVMIGNGEDTSYMMKLNSKFKVQWVKHFPLSRFQNVQQAYDGGYWLTGLKDSAVYYYYRTIIKTDSLGNVTSSNLLKYLVQSHNTIASVFQQGANHPIFVGSKYKDEYPNNTPGNDVIILQMSSDGVIPCPSEPFSLLASEGPEPEVDTLVLDLISFNFETFADSIDIFPMSYETELCSGFPVNTSSETATIEIDLYPNPASENLFVECNSILSSVEVYDCLGRKVFNSGKLNSEKLTIGTGHWQKGMYFVSCTEKDGWQRRSAIMIQ